MLDLLGGYIDEMFSSDFLRLLTLDGSWIYQEVEVASFGYDSTLFGKVQFDRIPQEG